MRLTDPPAFGCANSVLVKGCFPDQMEAFQGELGRFGRNYSLLLHAAGNWPVTVYEKCISYSVIMQSKINGHTLRQSGCFYALRGR